MDASRVRAVPLFVEEAKASPGLHIDIPVSAPFSPKAVENLRGTSTYSVILSNGLSANAT